MRGAGVDRFNLSFAQNLAPGDSRNRKPTIAVNPYPLWPWVIAVGVRRDPVEAVLLPVPRTIQRVDRLQQGQQQWGRLNRFNLTVVDVNPAEHQFEPGFTLLQRRAIPHALQVVDNVGRLFQVDQSSLSRKRQRVDLRLSFVALFTVFLLRHVPHDEQLLQPVELSLQERVLLFQAGVVRTFLEHAFQHAVAPVGRDDESEQDFGCLALDSLSVHRLDDGWADDATVFGRVTIAMLTVYRRAAQATAAASHTSSEESG